MPQLIEIPIKPYLKKFVVAHFEGEPIKASEDDLFGRVFISCLKKSDKYRPKPQPRPGSVIVKVSDCTYIKDIDPRYHHLEVDQQAVLQIEKFFERLFDIHLFAYLDGVRAANKEMRIHILHWLDYHDISPDELNYETAKKRYYRHRKRKDLTKAARSKG